MRPILITDLGMQFATSTSKVKKRHGLYECPGCKKHWRVMTGNVKSGSTTQCRSCATVAARTTHGLSKHKLYKTWQHEIQRCNNPKDSDYKNYGGRGITISAEFEVSANWLKYVESLPDAYKPGYTIDRIDNDGNYERGNLRWASKDTQNQNTRLIHSNNTSGFRGVSKRGQKWMAKIDVSGKQIYIGTFTNILSAMFERDMYVIANKLEHTLNYPDLVECSRNS